MATERNPIRVLLPTYALAFFWGGVVVLKLCWKFVRYGPRKFFYTKRRDTRPQLLDDPALGSHNFARLQNVKLHFVTLGPEDGPLMLFVHGFPEFWYSWRHQMKEFSKKYKCVAFDMRGYSESDKPRGVHNYTMEQLTNDIKELIPALGYEKAVLVGHDWGGAVVWDFAWRNPDMVDRLVVCNCPNSKAFASYIAKNRTQFLKSWYMFFFQLPLLPEVWFWSWNFCMYHSMNIGFPRHCYCDRMRVYNYYLSEPGGITGAINLYRASFRYKRAPYPTTNMPVRTLLIWGTADGALEKEMAQLSGRFCDDCTVKYIEGASHWVQQDEPQLTNSYISEFLDN